MYSDIYPSSNQTEAEPEIDAILKAKTETLF